MLKVISGVGGTAGYIIWWLGWVEQPLGFELGWTGLVLGLGGWGQGLTIKMHFVPNRFFVDMIKSLCISAVSRSP